MAVNGQLQLVTVLVGKGESPGLAWGLAWSPWGDRLAIAGFDDRVIVFDAESGKRVVQTPQLGTVTCVSWSPDGRTLVCATSQGTVHMFTADTCEELRHATGSRKEITSIDHSPDGQFLAITARDGQLRIRTIPDLSTVTTVAAHTDHARSVAWAPHSTHLVTSGHDNAVRVWQAGTWLGVGSLADHANWVPRALFSPDGRLLVSGSLDSTARVWDFSTQRYSHVYNANGRWVIDLAISPDSTLLAVLNDLEIIVYDLLTGRAVASTPPPSSAQGAERISWRPGSRNIATAGRNAVIWDLPG